MINISNEIFEKLSAVDLGSEMTISLVLESFAEPSHQQIPATKNRPKAAMPVDFILIDESEAKGLNCFSFDYGKSLISDGLWLY